MAAGASDLLDDVFFSDVDEKVVSDLVGSLESQLAATGHNAAEQPGIRAQVVNNHVENTPGMVSNNVELQTAENKMGLAGAEVSTAAKIKVDESSEGKNAQINSQNAFGSGVLPCTTAGSGAQQSVVINNARSQAPGVEQEQSTAAVAAVTGSSETSASGSIGQGKSVVISAMATPVSNHVKTVTSNVQTLNGNNGMAINSHNAGNATSFTCSAAATTLPAVTVVNNGPGSVVKNTINTGLPAVSLPVSSSAYTVIQTSFVSTQNVPSTVVSSQTAGPTVTLVRPPAHSGPVLSVASTPNGSSTILNSTVSVTNLPAPSGTGTPHQTSLLTLNSQTSSLSSNTSLSAGGQVIKSDLQPKTIIQTPQQTLGAGILTSTTGSAATTINNQSNTSTMVIGQTIQSGLQNVASNPGGISTQSVGTPVGMGKGTINTVAQTMARTAAVNTGPRTTITPQVIAPRLPQPQQHQPNIQNIQIPPGMVLVRSDSGQLMLIPQQALQQMQSQAQSQGALTSRSATPTSGPPVQISTVQAPGTQIIARQVTPTIIKPVSQPQTTVQVTTALQRPPTVQSQIVISGSTSAASIGTATTVQPGTPQRSVQTLAAAAGGPSSQILQPTASAETMENVKKCKNFLSTLIKLASSGKQSTETAANVKELVQNLLDGKIEAEDFTSRLYRELNSSPQPYLVPFLKRSLPALRQLTQDSQAFIQQSQQQSSTQTTTALTAVVLGNTVQQRPVVRTTTATATVTSTLQHPVLSLTQPGQSVQTGKVVQQQQGTIVRPQVTLTQTPMVTLRQPQNRIMLTGSSQVQLKQLQTVPVMKQTVVPGTKAGLTYSVQTSVVQKNKLKEAAAAAAAASGSFRDDDDINDVASMAGVNLSEESARILATNSELVGTLTRSCKDEAFLFAAPLHRRMLEIGKKHGITDVHPDVVNFVSHATQQRLQTLVEKISEVAQQRNISYKEDDRYEQLNDVKSQLKFFEQLDQIEKQRKDEQEREILMRAAKSRSRQEDPEQLRLKQKAKEMQQQELAQMRQREANLTALAAIGPRKKRKVDSPGPGIGAGTEGPSTGGTPGASGVGTPRQFTRQRITRVNLRDLIFCLENERETSHSLMLYRAFLK
ncbi:transcription initiation factor TFIID subunit 4 isoform X1 [Chiloscyllium plagiosum]|uniref:transcription initiation factor TFIID subunit 4 isoform X1 n=1 Tax=Chiloscyllium plagiosum TaxID=36176 RepID=UPI001CB85194|nr:transcription initiation factor TFIID subunit 4 isoform X1 [Chiloscyllium plagiosum]